MLQTKNTELSSDDCHLHSENILACSDDRRGAQLYRIAVELSVLLNIIAATNHFSKEEVRELRESCEEEVKRLNGTLRLDDAVRWQNS